MLMPGVGVTDTSTIFALVGAHRGSVLVSVGLQLGSAAADALAVVGMLDALATGLARAGDALL
jgi:hypothetical protein